MPDMTMPGSSRSDPRSTCRASSGNGSADTSREELGEALVGLPRADLHADLDHGVTLLLQAEDAPISQLGHAIALDEGDLHEAVAGWPVATRNVYTRRSGAPTSRYSPWKSTSSPPDVCVMYSHWPPGRTSIFFTSVVSRRRPHHFGMRSGSVIVSQTTSRGASNLRVMRISRSDGSVMVVSCFVLVATVFLLSFLCLPLADQVVQPIEPLVDPAPEFLQPRAELAEGL